MSSTCRGVVRDKTDHYITPQQPIRDFLTKFSLIEKPEIQIKTILDPCAGGNQKYEMPYPAVLKSFGYRQIITNDIREDSRAELKADYLTLNCQTKFDMIISNPPFSLAVEFIKKAFNEVVEGGYIIMLSRLNFLGSQERLGFWKEYMPKFNFVHSKRMSFFPDDFYYINKKGENKIIKANSTDSIEYSHFVFQKGHSTEFTKTFVI